MPQPTCLPSPSLLKGAKVAMSLIEAERRSEARSRSKSVDWPISHIKRASARKAEYQMADRL